MWWAKYYHPVTAICLRDSLGTADRARAELLCRRLEMELELARPDLASVELPEKIRARIGIQAAAVRATEGKPTPNKTAAVSGNATVHEAIGRYYRFIAAENDEHHAKGKLSILRAFFGTTTVTKATGVDCRNKVAGYYHEATIGGITAAVLQDIFDQLPVADKTKKHYREVMHHLFEKMLDFEMFTPPNPHRPNPVATLPSYDKKNEVITYLKSDDIIAQRKAVESNPSILLAVDIMLESGLRREEVLGLRRTDVVKDGRQINVSRYVDAESGVVHKLKTGCRKLPTGETLRAKLLMHFETLSGDWVVPGPSGRRWSADWFSKNLAKLNKAAGIHWTCAEYRHTYATTLASQGASLLKIAKRLGDTYQTAERYYIQFVDDDLDPS